MFIVNNIGLTFSTIENNNGSNNGLFLSAPTRSTTADTCGVEVVAQFLEGLKYRITGKYYQIQPSTILQLYSNAMSLDENELEITDKFPSLKNILNSCTQMKLITNGKITYFNTINSLKHQLDMYNSAIIETKITTSTYNQHEFNITTPGDIITEDFTKGFVAYKYDSSGIVLQNTLGTAVGSQGFHRMSWDVFSSVFVKAASITSAQ